MAVNQNHTENRRGAIIPYGESVLQHCHNVDLSFPQQPEGSHLFGGTKRGTLFLTSYRVIFVTSHSVSDPLFSFMMPFDLMSNCSLEQPVFAANYIRGTIQAAPDAYPVVVYGPQPVRYGAPLAGYGAPPAGYGAPPAVYGAPPVGYGAPPEGYGGPPMGYGGPPMGYGAPPAGYPALPVEYRAPHPGYEALPVGYGAPPAGYGTLPAEYGAPPAINEPPSARYTAGSHSSVAAQPAGHEASPPSTSSPQAHLPSSKM